MGCTKNLSVQTGRCRSRSQSSYVGLSSSRLDIYTRLEANDALTKSLGKPLDCPKEVRVKVEPYKLKYLVLYIVIFFGVLQLDIRRLKKYVSFNSLTILFFFTLGEQLFFKSNVILLSVCLNEVWAFLCCMLLVV